MVKKILFITLSNIGDCILTLPALDSLLQEFPEAGITVITAERPKEIFRDNPHIEKIIVYQKQAGIKENLKLFLRLRKEKFDVVIDLRNTLFGALLPVKYKIPALMHVPARIAHMKDRHLYKIQNSKLKIKNSKAETISLRIKPEDEKYISSALEQNNIKKEDRIIVVAPGARSHIKRWGRDKFGRLCVHLAEEKFRIILAGDNEDSRIAEYIQENYKCKAVNLCNHQ
jgi:heptosyltransferase III